MFFREFTFSKNTFRFENEEVELADAIVHARDIMWVFQLKERAKTEGLTQVSEERWFSRKVVGEATRQIRQTVSLLRNSPSVVLNNNRGHAVHLAGLPMSVHKVVAFRAAPELPQSCRDAKYHRSATAGFIHLFSASDYGDVLGSLLTLAEVNEYLTYREAALTKWPTAAQLPERALLGQFLLGDEHVPRLDSAGAVHALVETRHEWDMTSVISTFGDRIVTEQAPTDHYPILQELAVLKRTELREFRRRFDLALKVSRRNEVVRPYRMTVPRTDCAFVVIPLTDAMKQHRANLLHNLTVLHQYEQRVPRCVGLAMDWEGESWYMEWAFRERVWSHDPELEQALASNEAFRPVELNAVPTYKFDTDA